MAEYLNEETVTRDFLVNKFGNKCKRLFRPTMLSLDNVIESDRKSSIIITTDVIYASNWNIQLTVLGSLFNDTYLDNVINILNSNTVMTAKSISLGDVALTGAIFYNVDGKLRICIYPGTNVFKYALVDLINIDSEDSCNRLITATLMDYYIITELSLYEFIGQYPNADKNPIGNIVAPSNIHTTFSIDVYDESAVGGKRTIDVAPGILDINITKVFASKTADSLGEDITFEVNGDAIGSGTLVAGLNSVTLNTSLKTSTEAGTYYKVTVNNKGIVTSGSNDLDMPVATSTSIGGIKLGHEGNTSELPIILDQENKAYVSVAGKFLADPGNWNISTHDATRVLYKTIDSSDPTLILYGWIKGVMVDDKFNIFCPLGVYSSNHSFQVSFTGGTTEATHAVAIGEDAYSLNNNSISIGHGTKTTSTDLAVFGAFNKTDDTSAALIIGNGTSDNDRSTAFTVSKEGVAIAQTEVQCGTHKLTEKISLDTALEFEESELEELNGKTLKDIIVALFNK